MEADAHRPGGAIDNATEFAIFFREGD